MGLREAVAHPMYTLANRLQPNVFYVVPALNGDTQIKSLTGKDVFSYLLKTGRVPYDPELVFVGGGGSSKAYWTLGFLLELLKYVRIDRYIVTSAPSFVIVYEKTKDLKLFEEFALGIPEMLPKKPIPTALRIARLMALGWHYEDITQFGSFLNVLSKEEVHLSDDVVVKAPKGAADTTPLERELDRILEGQPIGNFKTMYMMATDFGDGKGNHGGPVVLGRDYHDMPASRAAICSAALPLVLPYPQYAGHLFGDAGIIYNFPLLEELVGKAHTIVGVDLDYNNGTNLDELPFFFADDARKSHVRNRHITNGLVRKLADTGADDLLQNNDRKKNRFYMEAPELPDVLPGNIDIPMPQRKELVTRGREAAEKAIQHFRQPIWNVPVLIE